MSPPVPVRSSSGCQHIRDVLSLLDHIAFSFCRPATHILRVCHNDESTFFPKCLDLLYRSEILHKHQEQPPPSFDMGRNLCHLRGHSIRRGHLFHARIAHLSYRLKHLDGIMGKLKKITLKLAVYNSRIF